MDENFNIKRIKEKDKYKYININSNKEIKNQNILEKIQKKYIPPAYNPVYINKDIEASCYAIGEDIKGKKQYLYNKKWTEQQSQKKYQNMILFAKKYKKLEKNIYSYIDNYNMISPENFKNFLISIAIYLIIKCNFRVGTKENEKSFGVTTLKKNHFNIKKNSVYIEFIGKRGIINKCLIDDKKIAYILKKLKETNENEFFFKFKKCDFQTYINANDINLFIKKYGNFSSKDIRTYRSNILFLEFFKKNQKKNLQKNKLIKYCIQQTAQSLHNTESICKKSYINNDIINYLKENDYIITNVNKDLRHILQK